MSHSPTVFYKETQLNYDFSSLSKRQCPQISEELTLYFWWVIPIIDYRGLVIFFITKSGNSDCKIITLHIKPQHMHGV